MGDVRQRLEEVLGSDADEAPQVTAQLLANPHPPIGRAIALWDQISNASEAFLAWRKALPAEVECGRVPAQEELDRWADRQTLGMIQKFPVEVDPQTIFVMASALATRATWSVPFDTVPATELGAASPWSSRLKEVLRTPEEDWHAQLIADTDRAGRVAALIVEGHGGLLVVSVIADEGVAAPDVIAAAHQIAEGAAGWSDPAGYTVCSLHDLPLGEEPRWVIDEEPTITSHADGREESYRTTIPAWSARTTLDLAADDSTGFSLVGEALFKVIDRKQEALARGLDPEEPLVFAARQSTAAQFHAAGFEAASVVGMGIVLGAAGPPEYRGSRRNAHLRFGHPYAVVAVMGTGQVGATSYWDGLPVFSAWVADPEEPDTSGS